MKITKKKLLEELNKDLEWEYAAAIQYLQHQAVINGAKYDSIKKELLLHSQEEMTHAVMLADQIDFLGGVPRPLRDDLHHRRRKVRIGLDRQRVE